MKKEFLPYELAVKLKELGFDEPCFNTYNLDKKVSRNPSHNMEDLPIEGQPYYWQNSKIHVSCITAPTFSQAFRWFDENTELKGFVCPSIKEEHFDWLIRIDWEEEIECEEAYPSRQEAELACLTKLISIVEQQKQK